MSPEERKEVVDEILVQCLSVMQGKGREYSRGEEDVNSNFKRVGQALGLSALTVAAVYYLKHVDSLTSYIKEREAGRVPVLAEPIEGRLVDLINYAFIIASLVREAEDARGNR